ncbi:protein FAR1-RELATED SEQUENCE 4-like [Vicia villosa]|uniref:protein FAR1-RELATED SEQUENCE 4-like n=1 Tax=Vicia villosa TaxID=3911 RepID=UPI00273CC13F|nr:protein FAR1-RELATED SEQUENCE 4-like [Vicia villosa]
MQQILKLLDDSQYDSKYRACENNVTIHDIFWTHQESIKLFNTFSNVLIIDLTYKTNKYRLPLLETVGMTSKDKTFSVGFAFLECEKEDNFTWALRICKTLLVDPYNMPSVIVTDRDNALMNPIGTVFPTSTVLLCQYHIIKNVRSKLKPAIDNFDKIHDALVPSFTSHALISKWMSFPKMSHLIARAYDRVCVDLTRFGFSMTFFPIHSRPPIDASGRIIYIVYLRSCHFGQGFLKSGCPIPVAACHWTTHHTKEADVTPHFYPANIIKTELQNFQHNMGCYTFNLKTTKFNHL